MLNRVGEGEWLGGEKDPVVSSGSRPRDERTRDVADVDVAD